MLRLGKLSCKSEVILALRQIFSCENNCHCFNVYMLEGGILNTNLPFTLPPVLRYDIEQETVVNTIG